MVNTYKCPGCGAPIEFDGVQGEMVCDYCGKHVNVSEMNTETDSYECDVEDATEDKSEYGSFDSYKCSNCGAEILTDEHTSATMCSYCGSPALIKNRLNGELMPAAVIPFRLNKAMAKEKFASWTRKGMLTPSCFKKEATVNSIEGIYVPFWLYDYDAHVDMTADATRVKRERKGDMEYTHTSHYKILREIEASYDKIPADASARMPDDVMDKLEPFDYNDMTKFEMPYLSGYCSEKYNFTKEEINYRAERRANSYAFKECRDTIKGYSSIKITNSRTRLRRNRAMYTLFPVWMLNYKYKNKDYFFAVNGQTGKIVGKLPLSKKKMALWFFGIFAGMEGIMLLFGGLL